MVSICVPTYCYDPSPLIESLRIQMAALDVPSELLVYDDASPAFGGRGAQVQGKWLEKWTGAPGIMTRRLPENLGRGAIRNLLVRDAQYPYVLLLDVDAALPQDFLTRYRSALPDQSDQPLVISGGRNYAPTLPEDPTLHLHWWYGRERESTGRAHRHDPYHGFQSNNFLASRDLLLTHPFPEDAEGYGHEDTLWGQQLRNAKVPILRIPNEVTHLGLEPAATFLDKQREAVRNLVRLRSANPFLRTRLTDWADRAALARLFLPLLPESRLSHYLITADRPDLRVLDLLKLKWFFDEKKRAIAS